MKVINLILAFLLTLFAYFQINDPDPVLWVSIYLAVAIICAFAAFGKYNRIVIIFAILGLFVYLGILMPDFLLWLSEGMPSITGSMKAESMYIELIREFLGLLLLLMILGWQYSRMKKVQLTEK